MTSKLISCCTYVVRICKQTGYHRRGLSLANTSPAAPVLDFSAPVLLITLVHVRANAGTCFS